jgi:Fe2+ or Zn2+ uptake regulation protein
VYVKQATEELREHGFRLTRQRLAVLTALSEAGRGLEPAQVLERARLECPELGLATVYRALELLESLGMVRHVHTSKSSAAVAGAGAGHAHHVVCTICGRVAEFSTCDLEALEEAAARETGFSIGAHFLELAGICRECQKKRSQEHSDRKTGGTGK